MLNISIPNWKTLSNEEKNENLKEEIFIFEKYDGIKISLIRTNKSLLECNSIDDYWIVSYKGWRFFSNELQTINRETVKFNSIGLFQIVFVWDWLLLKWNDTSVKHELDCSIPYNTEFLLEFIVRKPTVTRDYNKLNDIFLISAAKINTIKSNGFKIITETGPQYDYKKVTVFNRFLNAKLPRILFRGKAENENLLYEMLKVESELGGPQEGIIIKNNSKLFKLLQLDQHDKATRLNKKLRWEMVNELELEYFNQLKSIANKFIQQSNFTFNTFQHSFLTLYSNNTLPAHTKKNLVQIKEDLFYCTKYMLHKKLQPQWALFIGRMQPPTLAHLKIIKEALKKWDGVVIAIVNAKKDSLNPFTYEIRKELLELTLSKVNAKRFSIIQTKSSNLPYIINSIEQNIVSVYCGEDRFQSYQQQLIPFPEINLHKISREPSGISATAVRQSILTNNETAFKTLTSEEIHVKWHELKRILKETLNN